jgi:hypothetical protein
MDMTVRLGNWARGITGFSVLLVTACDNLAGVPKNIMPRAPSQYALLAEPPDFFTQPEQWQPGLQAHYRYASGTAQSLDEMTAAVRPVEVAQLPRVEFLPGRSADFDVPVMLPRDEGHYRTLALLRKEIPAERRTARQELTSDREGSLHPVGGREATVSRSVPRHSRRAEYVSAFFDITRVDPVANPDRSMVDLHGTDLFDPRVKRNRAGADSSFYPDLRARSRRALD